MALPYSAYVKKVKHRLDKFSYEQLLFIGAWTADYLNREYGFYLDEIGHGKEREWLQEAIDFLWRVVDNSTEMNEGERKRILKRVRGIDIADLDFAIPAQCGILKIMEAVERMLCFVADEKQEHVLVTAWFPLDVINAVKDSRVEPFMTPPTYEIDDVSFQEELSAQLRLFYYLGERAKPGSVDRFIFRRASF